MEFKMHYTELLIAISDIRKNNSMLKECASMKKIKYDWDGAKLRIYDEEGKFINSFRMDELAQFVINSLYPVEEIILEEI